MKTGEQFAPSPTRAERVDSSNRLKEIITFGAVLFFITGSCLLSMNPKVMDAINGSSSVVTYNEPSIPVAPSLTTLQTWTPAAPTTQAPTPTMSPVPTATSTPTDTPTPTETLTSTQASAPPPPPEETIRPELPEPSHTAQSESIPCREGCLRIGGSLFVVESATSRLGDPAHNETSNIMIVTSSNSSVGEFKVRETTIFFAHNYLMPGRAISSLEVGDIVELETGEGQEKRIIITGVHIIATGQNMCRIVDLLEQLDNPSYVFLTCESTAEQRVTCADASTPVLPTAYVAVTGIAAQ